MNRKGVTLLEVMFSIGVAAVGLLGIMAVLPLALHQVGSGNVADRASRIGMNALSEFQLRGMGDPATWRVWTSSGFTAAPAPPYSQSSFTIDPRILAVPANQTPAGSLFPYVSAAQYRMPRMTLRADSSLLPTAMSEAQADDVFVVDDDLVFDLPDDKTLPPLQSYAWSPGADGQWGVSGTDDDANGTIDDGSEAGWSGSDDVRFRRNSEGRFSWMAMITPRVDQRVPNNYPDANSDLYTLYVVVFHKRSLQLDSLDEPPERIARIEAADFHAQGYNGGDVTITQLPTASNPIVDLEMKRGDWVLLAGQLAAMTAPVTPGPFIFRWYQVDDTEREPTYNSAASRWERDATLYGPDWPVNKLMGDTQVVLVANVVSVYQKTIRLESSSLWSD